MTIQLTRCDQCQHTQRTIVPWKHVPICRHCRKPMKAGAGSAGKETR